MLIATVVMVVGLTIGAWAATTRGYRLSGVVVVSLLAIYALVDVVAVPMFVLSALLAYLVIQAVQNRWLLYGRPLLLTAILVGAVLPVLGFVVVDLFMGHSLVVRDIDYIGSILPGIAAYNFHRADADRRLPELLGSAGLLVGLIGLGIVSLLLWSRPPCVTCDLLGISPADYVAPILLTGGSDVAGVLGLATVDTPGSIGSLGAVTAIVLLGLVVGEFGRERWGLRPVGVIALPLVALFALRSWWILPLYVGIALGSFGVIQAVHSRTFLYGRGLLSIAAVSGVLLAVPALVLFGLTEPVGVFFAGLLGGIGAYYLHTAAPGERVATVTVNAGIFVAIFAVARVLIEPRPGGLGTSLGWPDLLVGGLVILATIRVLVRLERIRPSERTLRSHARVTGGGNR
ncbi:MAG: poly-gamma-glutamate biosynthesis protein PgsC/CapC [Haloarculaceae archaeon]